jgi:hypothetical protein
LGSNEVQEATVVTNPYSGQYGQLSGAQVTYITKSGTNDFHGNAQYWWNGRYLNANDFFNKWTTPAGVANPAPFGNANRWATSIGGPIIKNKTFSLPITKACALFCPALPRVYVPTQAFSTAVLNNIANTQPAELAMYKQIFGLWANAPGAANAVVQPANSFCSGVVLPGFDPSAGCTARSSPRPRRWLTNSLSRAA